MNETADIQCHEALRRLYEFLDGEITPEIADKVRSHIEICQRCYPHVRFATEFRDAVQRASRGQPPCPDSLRAKVGALIEEEGVE